MVSKGPELGKKLIMKDTVKGIPEIEINNVYLGEGSKGALDKIVELRKA